MQTGLPSILELMIKQAVVKATRNQLRPHERSQIYTAGDFKIDFLFPRVDQANCVLRHHKDFIFHTVRIFQNIK